MSNIAKSTQSCSNGHLPYHCLFYFLARARSMYDVACEFACAVAMGANVLKSQRRH